METAIKFSRAHTGRAGLLYATGAFHGLTCGALSLMGNPFWREGFGPLLPGAEEIPFGDLPALQEKLASRRFAALILEPIQAEAGIRIPFPEYLAMAQALCRKHGSVFVLDEVQTGLGRTGKFLVNQFVHARPRRSLGRNQLALVSRFRSSQAFAATSERTSESKRTLATL